jgi:hypothetical protein
MVPLVSKVPPDVGDDGWVDLRGSSFYPSFFIMGMINSRTMRAANSAVTTWPSFKVTGFESGKILDVLA